jgi:hypothetical protein
MEAEHEVEDFGDINDWEGFTDKNDSKTKHDDVTICLFFPISITSIFKDVNESALHEYTDEFFNSNARVSWRRKGDVKEEGKARRKIRRRLHNLYTSAVDE